MALASAAAHGTGAARRPASRQQRRHVRPCPIAWRGRLRSCAFRLNGARWRMKQWQESCGNEQWALKSISSFCENRFIRYRPTPFLPLLRRARKLICYFLTDQLRSCARASTRWLWQTRGWGFLISSHWLKPKRQRRRIEDHTRNERLKLTIWPFMQIVGIVCLIIVILTHVAEAFQILPGMGWGLPSSPGHYLDLTSAILGCTLLPLGILGHVLTRRRNSN